MIHNDRGVTTIERKPLRVAVVITGSEGFGIRSFLLDQFRHAESVGMHFSYLSLQPGPLQQELALLGAELIVVGGQVPCRYPSTSLLLPLFWLAHLGAIRSAYKGLRRALESARPELVYTHSIYTAFLCGLLARRLDFRIVGQFHGILNRRRLLGLQRVLCSLAMARLLDSIVAISRPAFDVWWGPARGKIHLLYNGVDLRVIGRSVVGVRKKVGRLVIVGRLVALKNQALLVRAVRSLIDEGFDCTLDIVGGPAGVDNPYYRELRGLVESLRLGDRVVFRGVISPPYSTVAEAEVSVNCSSIDSFGLVVAESMACGTAVVVADQGGPADLVVDGRTGMVFRSNDLSSLVSALRRLLTEPETRDVLARNALREVERRFSIEAHMRGLRELFDTVLAEHSVGVTGGT